VRCCCGLRHGTSISLLRFCRRDQPIIGVTNLGPFRPLSSSSRFKSSRFRTRRPFQGSNRSSRSIASLRSSRYCTELRLIGPGRALRVSLYFLTMQRGSALIIFVCQIVAASPRPASGRSDGRPPVAPTFFGVLLRKLVQIANNAYQLSF
jgi:hypothetical protein